MNEKQLTFNDLWNGDRFSLSNGTIWTKLSHTTARKHEDGELALKERGYGYIGSHICSFETTDEVNFIPVGQ